MNYRLKIFIILNLFSNATLSLSNTNVLFTNIKLPYNYNKKPKSFYIYLNQKCSKIEIKNSTNDVLQILNKNIFNDFIQLELPFDETQNSINVTCDNIDTKVEFTFPTLEYNIKENFGFKFENSQNYLNLSSIYNKSNSKFIFGTKSNSIIKESNYSDLNIFTNGLNISSSNGSEIYNIYHSYSKLLSYTSFKSEIIDGFVKLIANSIRDDLEYEEDNKNYNFKNRIIVGDEENSGNLGLEVSSASIKVTLDNTEIKKVNYEIEEIGDNKRVNYSIIENEKAMDIEFSNNYNAISFYDSLKYDSNKTKYLLTKENINSLLKSSDIDTIYNSLKDINNTIVENWSIKKELINFPIMELKNSDIFGLNGLIYLYYLQNDSYLNSISYQYNGLLYPIYKLNNSEEINFSELVKNIFDENREDIILNLKNKIKSPDLLNEVNHNSHIRREYNISDNNFSINYANLNFVSNLIEIELIDENLTNEKISIDILKDSINELLLVKFENGIWSEVNSTIIDSKCFFEIKDGIYGVVKDYIKKQNSFEKKFTNINMNSKSTIKTSNIKTKKGNYVKNTEFKVSYENFISFDGNNSPILKTPVIVNSINLSENGILTLNIESKNFIGEGNIVLKSLSGFLEDKIKVFVKKEIESNKAPTKITKVSRGWNMLGNPYNNSIDVYDFQNSFEEIWSYENFSWKNLSSNELISKEIPTNFGYWVKSKEDKKIIYRYDRLSDIQIDELEKGWHLISSGLQTFLNKDSLSLQYLNQNDVIDFTMLNNNISKQDSNLFDIALKNNSYGWKYSSTLDFGKALWIKKRTNAIKNIEENRNKKSWTIMVYGSANNNLTPQMIFDMLEMSATGSEEEFNIVVQADFDDSFFKNYSVIKTDEELGVGRYLIQKDEDFSFEIPPKSYTLEYFTKGYQSLQKSLIQRLPEQNMDSSDTLYNFINWAKSEYPAENYGLILWGHGGQWSGGFGLDTDNLSNSPFTKTMEPKVIAETIKNSDVNEFKFVAFDACLMGGFEIVREFAGLTEIFIGNPEIDFGLGMDYKNTLSWLKNNSDTTMEKFAKEEVKYWKAHHSTDLDNTLAMHAAYDVTKAEIVENYFNTYVADLVENYDSLSYIIPRIRRGIAEYNSGFEDLGVNNFSNYVDLTNIVWCFMRDWSDCLPREAIPESVNNAAVIFTTKAAYSVIASAKGDVHGGNVSGISIWYPVDGANKEQLDRYSLETTIGSTSPWNKFLEKVKESNERDKTPPKLFLLNNTDEFIIEDNITINYQVVDDNSDTYATKEQLWKKNGNNSYTYISSLGYRSIEKIGQEFFEKSWDGKTWFISAQNKKLPMGYRHRNVPSIKKGILVDYILYGNAYYVPPSKEFKDGEEVILIYNTKIKKISVAIKKEKDSSIAPKSVFLEPNGKLYPITYSMESIDSDIKKSLYSNYDFIYIPENGISDIDLIYSEIARGEYTIKILAEDNYGNQSEPLNVNIKKN